MVDLTSIDNLDETKPGNDQCHQGKWKADLHPFHQADGNSKCAFHDTGKDRIGGCSHQCRNTTYGGAVGDSQHQRCTESEMAYTCIDIQ